MLTGGPIDRADTVEMYRSRSYSQLGSLSLVLFVASVLLTTTLHVSYSSPVNGITALWLAGFVVAVAAVVRDRGRARLLPAYVTMTLCVLGILAALPTFLHQRIGADTHAAVVESRGRMLRVTQLVHACSAQQGGRPCTAAQFADLPEARKLGVRLGTRCTETGDICLSTPRDGSRVIEQVTRDIAQVGPLRVTTTVAPDGSIRIRCQAVRSGVHPRQEAEACGPDLDQTAAPTRPA
ncbi:MAG: hypothetical protein JWM98_832 [Thermoleophilia bacterium]|nr:hypothetical protein [Thermoleophilia bacterium]